MARKRQSIPVQSTGNQPPDPSTEDVNSDLPPDVVAANALEAELAAIVEAEKAAAEKALAELEAAAQAAPPPPPPPPEPFATFRYAPNAKVYTTFPSGTPVTIEFDGEGLFHCADNQWWSAVCRATVDADIPPGRIVQVSSKVVV